MPTREEIITGMKAANAAGDIAAVNEMAAYLDSMQDQSSVESLATNQQQTKSNQNNSEEIISYDEISRELDSALSKIPGAMELTEFAAGINRPLFEALDFLGPDNINAILNIAGSSKRVPTFSESFGTEKGQFKEGLTGRVLGSAGEFAGMAAGTGAAIRHAASKLPALTEAGESAARGVLRQAGSVGPASDIGYGVASGVGAELGREAGGETGALLGSIAAPASTAILGSILRKGASSAASAASDAASSLEAAEATALGNPLSPAAQSAQQRELLKLINQVVESKPKTQGSKLRELTGDAEIDPTRLAAAERLGVSDDLLASQLARNQSYIEIESGLASIPGSKLSTQSKNAITSVAQKADDLITEFGGSTDKAQLSQVMKEDITKTINDLSDEAEVIYRSISEIIPSKAVVNTKNIVQDLQKKAAERGGVDGLSKPERNILKVAMKKSLPEQRRNAIFNQSNRQENGPTYALVDSERKKIGAALGKSEGPYKDEQAGILRNLYRQLTEAQESVARKYGADELWDTGKSLVSQRKQLEDNSIVLMGKDVAGAIMPKVGASMKKLSSGDYKDFDRVIGAMPPEARETAVVSALNDVFTMGSRAEKQMSMPGFVDWYEGMLRNQASMTRLNKNLPEGAKERLNDIFLVAKGIRNASKEKITTGRINSLMQEFNEPGGMISKIYGIGKQAAAAEGAGSSVGVPGVGATAVITRALTKEKTPLTKAADDLLSSAEFKRLTREYASQSSQLEARREAARRALEKSERYQTWLRLIPASDRTQVLRFGLMDWISDPQKDQEQTKQQQTQEKIK